MKKKILLALALVTVLVIGAGVSSFAIPPCSQICDSGWCELLCQGRDSFCSSYSTICIGDQGYCRVQCWNGNTYNSICHAYCPGGGGSPIFRKPIPIEHPQPEW